MEIFPKIPTRYVLSGDKEAARRLLHIGHRQLARLNRDMQFSKMRAHSNFVELPGGATVKTIQNYGLNIIEIYAPVTSDEVGGSSELCEITTIPYVIYEDVRFESSLYVHYPLESEYTEDETWCANGEIDSPFIDNNASLGLLTQVRYLDSDDLPVSLYKYDLAYYGEGAPSYKVVRVVRSQSCAASEDFELRWNIENNITVDASLSEDFEYLFVVVTYRPDVDAYSSSYFVYRWEHGAWTAYEPDTLWGSISDDDYDFGAFIGVDRTGAVGHFSSSSYAHENTTDGEGTCGVHQDEIDGVWTESIDRHNYNTVFYNYNILTETMTVASGDHVGKTIHDGEYTFVENNEGDWEDYGETARYDYRQDEDPDYPGVSAGDVDTGGDGWLRDTTFESWVVGGTSVGYVYDGDYSVWEWFTSWVDTPPSGGNATMSGSESWWAGSSLAVCVGSAVYETADTVTRGSFSDSEYEEDVAGPVCGTAYAYARQQYYHNKAHLAENTTSRDGNYLNYPVQISAIHSVYNTFYSYNQETEVGYFGVKLSMASAPTEQLWRVYKDDSDGTTEITDDLFYCDRIEADTFSGIRFVDSFEVISSAV